MKNKIRLFLLVHFLLAHAFILCPANSMAKTNPLNSETIDHQSLDLSMDTAVKMALENSNRLRATNQHLRLARHRLKQNLGFLPSINLEGTKNLDEKLMEIEIPPFYPGAPTQSTTLDFTRNYEFTLQIVQPVFYGGKIWHALQNARLDVEIAREQQRESRGDTIMNTKKMFLNVLVLEQLLISHQQALDNAKQNLKAVTANLQLGMASKFDQLQAELAVNTLKPDLARIKKELALAMLNLKIMTGIPKYTTLNITGKLKVPQNQSPKINNEPQIIQLSLSQNPNPRLLKLQMKKTNHLLKMAYGDFLPSLSLVAAYSFRTDAFRFSPNNNWENYYSVNLALRFPIFSGLKRTARVGEIKVMKKILDLDYQYLKDNLELQAKRLIMTLEQEYENIQTGLKARETAGEALRVAQLTYGEGMISVLELNAANVGLTRAETALLQAIYNYNVTLAELDKLTAEPVPARGDKQ